VEAFDQSSIERFSRQLILRDWSEALQRRISELELNYPATLTSLALYMRALGLTQLNAIELPRPLKEFEVLLKSPTTNVARLTVKPTDLDGISVTVEHSDGHSTRHLSQLPIQLDRDLFLGVWLAGILTDSVVNHSGSD